MAQIVKVEGRPTIPAGLYKAECLGTEVAEFAKGEYRKWTFTIQGGKFDGTQITGVSSLVMSPKAKAYDWYSALTGESPQLGDEIDLDSVIGRRVNLNVILEDTDNGKFNRIRDLIALGD
jgi:hypothetical protein